MKRLVVIAILFVMSLGIVAHSRADQQGEMEPRAYLPLVFNTQMAFSATEASPLYLQNYANGAGCDWLGAAGEVLDYNHRPVLNNSYRVHIWGSGIDEYANVGGAPAYSPSGWEQVLFDSPVVRDYQLQLETMDGTAVSPIYAIQTRAACNQNLLRFDFVQGNGL